MTVTEALTERKVLEDRINTAAENIQKYVARQASLVDPLARQGGSDKFVAEQLQSIKDLTRNRVLLQDAINRSNETVELTYGGITMTVAQWLIWNREMAPKIKVIYDAIVRKIDYTRNSNSQRSGVLGNSTVSQPLDTVVALDEKAFMQTVSDFQSTMGNLNGQITLKNSVTYIECE